MVVLFAFVLHYTKENLFTTVSGVLESIATGGYVDSALIEDASRQLDTVNAFVLLGMIVFSLITGILAAHITLEPTRDEFAQRKKFITAVAHELRTPLAVMRTSNEVALYDLDDKEEVKSVIESNIEESKHIANILNNLVVFSRVGAAESLGFEDTNVTECIQNVMRKLQTFGEKHNVVLIYDPEELPLISANPTALEQVFYNIIKNAIVYSKKEGGAITVNAHAAEQYLTVIISDTGIGISKKNLRHIFEPFFRINPDNSQFSAGTGLGLALVFEIMKLHKGNITVESVENKGTTFTLQFPISSLSLLSEPFETPNESVSFSFEK
jgi:signal transduction histidine kinase